MDSTPPTRTISASPTSTCREALDAASRLEPHSRFTVVSRDVDGKPGGQCRHPRDVAVLFSGTVGVAENDVVDAAGIQLREALQQLADDQRGQIIGPDVGQPTAETIEDRANPGVDVGVLLP